jgi:hypothetical protein
MKRQRIERYRFESSPGLVRIAMRQIVNAIGLGTIALVVLVVSWWYGPYGPLPAEAWAGAGSFYWIWSSFFGFVTVGSVAMALYREDWTVRPGELRIAKRFGPWAWERRVTCGRPLGVRITVQWPSSEGNIMPFGLRLMDAQGREAAAIELQGGRNIERCLAVLEEALPVDVDRPGAPGAQARAREQSPDDRAREDHFRRAEYRKRMVVVAAGLTLFALYMAALVAPFAWPSAPTAVRALGSGWLWHALMPIVLLPLGVWWLRCPACGGWIGDRCCRRCGRRY